MSIVGYDYVTVGSEYTTADLIVWRRYRIRAPGILEKMLDVNPHLAKLHKTSPFIPVGTQVMVPIDPIIMAGAPQPKTQVVLYGTKMSTYAP